MKLKQLVDIKIGLPLERKKAEILSDIKISYKMLTLKSFANRDNFNQLTSEEFIAKSPINSQFLTKENDVIVRLRTPNDATFINKDHTGLIVPALMAIIHNNCPNILNSLYLTYWLNSDDTQKQYIKNTQGTSIPMIKIADS